MQKAHNMSSQFVLPLTPADVHFPNGDINLKAIRQKVYRLNVRQFADMLNISRYTYRDWESGERTPSGPAQALLKIAAERPDVVMAVLNHGQDKPTEGDFMED